MNILLLNPPFIGKFSRASRSPAVTKSGTIYYPFWLAYAAGLLEQRGFNIRLVDAPADGLTREQILVKLTGFTPDLIVVDTSTPSIYEDVKCAAFLKRQYPHNVITLVGTHPSALPEETLCLDGAIDVVARGEYDETLVELAKAVDAGGDFSAIKGISYRAGNLVRHNAARALIEDVDRLPFVTSVYKKHLTIRNYYFAAARYPMVMIITGRGCPYRCFFCVYPQTFHGHRYRPRSPENVVAEFEYVKENLPQVREIGIEDDTFTAIAERSERICDLLIERQIGLPWYCNGRADISYPLLRKMRRAGCRLITVGFESADQGVLNAIHKGLTVERMLQFAMDARRAGILIHGCIMIGNPGENADTVRRSFDFALRTRCDSMQFYPLFVYPGTEAYDWARRSGYLKSTNFRNWLDVKGDYACVLDLPGLPAGKIVEICKRFYIHYHLRPSYILYKIWQFVTRPSEGLRTLRSGLLYLRFLWRDKIGSA
ncbi:MAG: radical SAM protein [Candidatus Aureabacteria bacterium]|nr:radical SAM protein [Candidatus Auribacterota bacterium]